MVHEDGPRDGLVRSPYVSIAGRRPTLHNDDGPPEGRPV